MDIRSGRRIAPLDNLDIKNHGTDAGNGFKKWDSVCMRTYVDVADYQGMVAMRIAIPNIVGIRNSELK